MMTWQQADAELSKRVKKFRYENPKVPYTEAVEIILGGDAELAAAYSGTDSPRTSNIIRQFELDRKLKENPGDPARDITEYQYKVTLTEAMGWRDGARIFGKIDLEKEIKEKIEREILNLENRQAQCKGIITNYPDKLKRQKEKIESLQAKLGSDIGHVPKNEEIRKEQDMLIALSGEHSDAQEDLPKIEAELNELRKKLDKIESGKKFSRQHCYESPSAELVGRAKEYQRQYGVDYETAVDEILESDEILNEAYMYRNIDQLLGLNN